jgi:hypothetical protein
MTKQYDKLRRSDHLHAGIHWHCTAGVLGMVLNWSQMGRLIRIPIGLRLAPQLFLAVKQLWHLLSPTLINP